MHPLDVKVFAYLVTEAHPHCSTVFSKMENLPDFVQKSAEDHIAAQANFISRVIDASPDMIHIVNIQTGTTVYINRMILSELGYSTEEIRISQLEKKFIELYHPDDIEEVVRFKDRILSATDDEVAEFDARLKAKNGSWQWIRTRAKVFARDHEGHPEKYIGFSQNVTANKMLEEEKKRNAVLGELNRAKTDFFNNVSHEFRTPLTLILGPLKELGANADKNTDPQFSHLIEVMQRNALRLQKLINAQLDFSRLEAGRFEAVFQPTDLARFTEDLCSNFRSLIEGAGLKFLVKCHDPEEPIYVSRDIWEMIVSNLLSNAYKYTVKGKIEVVLRVNKKHIQLHVNDTGRGISKENQLRIFERFTRIQAPQPRKYEGTGIGLALVKELVGLHGGSIKVHSEEGKGSSFIVLIPKGKSHLPAKQVFELNDAPHTSPDSALVEESRSLQLKERKLKASHAGHGQVPDGAAKPIVLVVDDNADMQQYFVRLIGGSFKVATAGDGSKALELIKAQRPDLIVCDIMMPQMDGIAFLKELKENSDTATIPVVIVSALGGEESIITALQGGADDYLVKPFSGKDLKARIDILLKRNARTGV
jgi:PAS domain S-box-containing protein